MTSLALMRTVPLTLSAGTGGGAQKSGGRAGQRLGIGLEGEGGVGRKKALLRACEELCADGFFQRVDMAADGRLGQAEISGGGRKRAMLEHGEEGAVEIPAWFRCCHKFLYIICRFFGNFVYCSRAA